MHCEQIDCHDYAEHWQSVNTTKIPVDMRFIAQNAKITKNVKSS